MIHYTHGLSHTYVRLLQLRGSVFPRAFYVACPCAVVSALIRWGISTGQIPLFEGEGSILIQPEAFTSFSALVGFLVVFRTSQSYGRFWDGCTSTHQMRAEWFDACSAIMSYCKVAKAAPETVECFQGQLLRLFSMLHAAALAELEEMNSKVSSYQDISAYQYKLIDPHGFDARSLGYIKTSASKVELLFFWIQMLIVQNIDNGVLCVAPPILSRAFHWLANGMVAFHDAVKITYIPFPFPYAQTCDFLLLIHWLICPLVISQWVSEPAWCGIFVFIQVFILWGLTFIACEIENPFGIDANDLDGNSMQEEMNRHLMVLCSCSAHSLPMLTPSALKLNNSDDAAIATAGSFLDVWLTLGDQPVPQTARKGTYFSPAGYSQLKVSPRRHPDRRTLGNSSSSSRSQRSGTHADAARGSFGERTAAAQTASRPLHAGRGTAQAHRPSQDNVHAQTHGQPTRAGAPCEDSNGRLGVDLLEPVLEIPMATQGTTLGAAQGDRSAGLGRSGWGSALVSTV